MRRIIWNRELSIADLKEPVKVEEVKFEWMVETPQEIEISEEDRRWSSLFGRARSQSGVLANSNRFCQPKKMI